MLQCLVLFLLGWSQMQCSRGTRAFNLLMVLCSEQPWTTTVRIGSASSQCLCLLRHTTSRKAATLTTMVSCPSAHAPIPVREHPQTNTCMHDAHFHSFHTTGVVVARRAAETAEPGRSRGFKEQVLCRPPMTCAMVQHHGACLYRMTGLATAVVVDPFALSARSLC